MRSGQLKIQQKWEDMMGYTYIALHNFPKSERFTLGAEIREKLLKGLALIIKANASRNKINLLYELDVEIKLLMALIRVACSLKILPFKKYELFSEKLVEIGKMTGGWIKYCKKF